MVSSSGLEIDSPALLTTRSTPPKASAAAANAAGDAVLVGHVGGDRDRATSAARRSPAATCRGRGAVPVGDHHAGALGGQPLRRWPGRCPTRRR